MHRCANAPFRLGQITRGVVEIRNLRERKPVFAGQLAQDLVILRNSFVPHDIRNILIPVLGTIVEREYTVPAWSRFNVDVGAMVPELSNESFGARIDATAPIVVERAIYSSTNGVLWNAGTNATATRLP